MAAFRFPRLDIRAAAALVLAFGLGGTGSAMSQDILSGFLLRSGDAPDAAPAPSFHPAEPAVDMERTPVEEDPFAATGVRAGAFTLRGSLDVGGGYDSNPFRVKGGDGSAFARVGGEASLKSGWSRHEVEARLTGGYTRYTDAPEQNYPELDAQVRGRLDVREDIELDALAGLNLSTLEPGDPDTPFGLTDRPLVTELRALAGVTYRPDPLTLRLGGRVERELYEDGRFQNGGVLDNSDRINTTYALDLRGSYMMSPKVESFTEASIDRRVYDETFDQGGLQRDSVGYSIASGFRYDPTALLTAEIKTGYKWRRYEDDNLPDLSGITADASLIWKATALTTVTLTAGTLFDDTTLASSSGSVTRFVRGEITHALRRNIAITASLQAERADYSGIGRTDDAWTANLGMEWRFSRRMGLTAKVAHTRLTSDVPGADYTATIYQAGLRFRY